MIIRLQNTMPNKIIKSERCYEIIKDKNKVKNTIEKKNKQIKI